MGAITRQLVFVEKLLAATAEPVVAAVATAYLSLGKKSHIFHKSGRCVLVGSAALDRHGFSNGDNLPGHGRRGCRPAEGVRQKDSSAGEGESRYNSPQNANGDHVLFLTI